LRWPDTARAFLVATEPVQDKDRRAFLSLRQPIVMRAAAPRAILMWPVIEYPFLILSIFSCSQGPIIIIHNPLAMLITGTFSLRWIGDRVSKMFKRPVRAAGLETDAKGQAHTTYFLDIHPCVFRSSKLAETTCLDWRRTRGRAF
tara:strand:- start:283 stop:717 length:435 start_codon:yes stop_codon:yes gene_type:complete